MNYISLINLFWDSAMTNPLSTGQVSLYLALLHVCNRSNWTEWFQVPNQVLSVLTGLSRSGILKARNELKQRGVIDFKERGTKATLYKIIAESKQVSVQESRQASKQEKSTIAKSKQVSTQDSVQNSTQNSVRNSVQNSSTLYKQNKNETKQEIPPISSVGHFEEFLSVYPKDSNRFMTEHEYASLLLTGKITENELVQCAQNYAEACKIKETPEEYIHNAENFLKNFVFEKYLPGKYITPKKPEKLKNQKKNFANFEQRNYEFTDLERKLLMG